MFTYEPTAADKADIPVSYQDESRYLGYREDDLAKPYAKYFTGDTLPVQPHVPEVLLAGMAPPATAGMMNSVIVIIGIPLGFVVPVVAARLRDQRPLVLGVVAGMVLGLGGLLLVPRAGWVWITIFGLATGSAFPLALTLLNLRSPTAAVTARLSGMAQSGGYLLAASGPLTFGLLHSISGGWETSIWLLLLLVLPELVCGLLAARPGLVRLSTRPEGHVEQLTQR